MDAESSARWNAWWDERARALRESLIETISSEAGSFIAEREGLVRSEIQKLRDEISQLRTQLSVLRGMVEGGVRLLPLPRDRTDAA